MKVEEFVDPFMFQRGFINSWAKICIDFERVVSSLISLVTLLYVIMYIIAEMHNSIYNSSIVEG
jgi:hypothetical protein